LKYVAVKLLLSMQTFRALDSRSLTAEAIGAKKATKHVRSDINRILANRMLVLMSRRVFATMGDSSEKMRG
jgi:hypothetical protein